MSSYEFCENFKKQVFIEHIRWLLAIELSIKSSYCMENLNVGKYTFTFKVLWNIPGIYVNYL